MSDYLMNTYHRLPVVFERGQGCYLYDAAGKAYLDFTAGIAVNCLGHNYPPLVKAVQEQAAKIMHSCNYYLCDKVALFAEKLVKACAEAGMKKVFLANSGGEANEGAIKIARKYSEDKYGKDRYNIVTLKASFHGRTITDLAATGQDIFHKDFLPLTPGFSYIAANDTAALDKALDPKTTAAIMVEAVQGESGIIPLSEAFLKEVRRLCTERDILLIADEVQCGLGRTGTFLAISGSGVKPDIVTMAKGIAGGIPAGAVLGGEKCCDTLGVGDHGSTFGGNPLACAAGCVVLDTVNQPAFLKEIVRKGNLIMDMVRSWHKASVKEVRGRGLMIGIDIDREAWPVLEEACSKGLLLLSAGAKTLRLLPPYIISDGEIEKGLEILKDLL